MEASQIHHVCFPIRPDLTGRGMVGSRHTPKLGGRIDWTGALVSGNGIHLAQGLVWHPVDSSLTAVSPLQHHRIPEGGFKCAPY